MQVFDQVFASNFVNHNPPPGSEPSREGFRKLALALQAAFPDRHSTIDHLLAEGDMVVWHWTWRGTHKGGFIGVPATGKQIEIEGITIDRIARGQIVERWSQMDNLGMMQQLGLIPPPGQG